ncbi:PAB1-binding protein 1 [Nannizzia gypsea CBS 118893]|uniref:PAB1-binding protein 1 n=1 Tax=Arthroderma gypseum (strain ATCC MYA-4604 / CBS 118893) TaxID=535722 RepID=E4V6H2_ARTGP|nr:PAB1-binding protein 1 [Nannizzia gypsea CBS 118893]EFQ96688.1 PAB1-binding protein 1 [Nannizzia gypsea CBS 118893]
MASTVNLNANNSNVNNSSSLASNGATASAPAPLNSAVSPNTMASRAAGRSSANIKGGHDLGRRQSGSPVDGGQRRPSSQKAWTQNINPATQKQPNTYTQQNGAASGRKSVISPSPASKESSTPDQHAHDRLIFLLTAAIGSNVSLTMKDGEKFAGIFSGSTLESNETILILKMARHPPSVSDSSSSPSTAATTQSNGVSQSESPYVGSGPDHQFSVMSRISPVWTSNPYQRPEWQPRTRNGASSGFRTDTDISGNQPGRERQLQRWEPSGSDATLDWAPESSGTAGWDQFETNARLFGATSSYDENIYTTRIDRSDPSYKRKEAEAARIAREIESTDTDNAHMREERGHTHQHDDADEEAKYSGVRRDVVAPLPTGQPNKYMPPARRPPTGQPTVPSAPVDPAIISAQLARPDSHAKASTPASQPKEAPSGKAAAQPEKEKEKASTAVPKATAEALKTVASNGAIEAERKAAAAAGASSQPSAASSTPRTGAENAASNVETEVLDHFRRFANDEKMKLQERRRNQASYDRTIKLNELMKFSKNFKLGTPVPKDLVPILAKDPSKQEEIIERAKRQHEEKNAAMPNKPSTATPATSSVSSNATADAKPATRNSATPRYEGGNGLPGAAPDRQGGYGRGGRQGYPPMGPHAGRQLQHPGGHPGRGGPGLLSHRLVEIQQQRKGANMGPSPAPLPTQDARMQQHHQQQPQQPSSQHQQPPASSAGDQGPSNGPPKAATHTPTSSSASTKFNVRAMEFKPNPAASTFTPASAAGSSSAATPVNTRPQSVPRATSPTAFFGSKKPLPASERPLIVNGFNPVKRMKKEATDAGSKDYAFNGGIPPAYRTAPTWDVSAINEKKTYADMFKPPVVAASASPQSRALNAQIPHQQQLPYHIQHAGHNMPPQNAPPTHLIPPQQPPMHYDDHHRMQMSASSSQVFPSPRLQHSTPMAYQHSVGPHNQMAMHGVPPYYPQPGHVRHYPNGPQFSNPPTAAPMMAQTSNGPYMNMPPQSMTPYNPPMQMFSPNPSHVYPQHAPPMQTHSGYPSPSRGAPMMMHQGSQQGPPPQPMMAMNGQQGQGYYPPQQPGHMPPMRPGHHQQHPHFASSPHQAHNYPHHQYRNQAQNNNNNNNNFNQMPHGPPPPMQPQGGPPPAATPSTHPTEAPEEVK